MHDVETQLERLDDIERKLSLRPEGWTTGELARVYQVNPSTIYRDLGKLERRGTGLIKVKRRYRLDHRRSLYSLKFTNHELVSLYLAARLLSRHSDEFNPHVVRALEKLADALVARSPLVARHIRQAAEAVGARPERTDYLAALEVLTEGWIAARKVRLRYHSYARREETERVFAPYFIEPGGPGYACYAIGYDELRANVRTLKVERIHDACLLDERFEIPAHFDAGALLRSAWGVIWDEEATEEVVLRFSQEVVRRVKESTWHHSQRVEDLPDGACLFAVRVGSTLELKPWIRQWGADVEVISPATLRRAIADEAARTAALYRLSGL